VGYGRVPEDQDIHAAIGLATGPQGAGDRPGLVPGLPGLKPGPGAALQVGDDFAGDTSVDIVLNGHDACLHGAVCRTRLSRPDVESQQAPQAGAGTAQQMRVRSSERSEVAESCLAVLAGPGAPAIPRHYRTRGSGRGVRTGEDRTQESAKELLGREEDTKRRGKCAVHEEAPCHGLLCLLRRTSP
jgi:hypothetical protein